MSGNSDHWTKLKVRAMPLRGAHPGDVLDVSSCSQYGERTFVNDSRESSKCVNKKRETIQLPFSTCRDNSSRKSKALNDSMLTVASPKSGLQKQWLNNSYQRRARDGFRYWLINRPPPTKFGKSGIGSYKTVIGIGMAARS